MKAAVTDGDGQVRIEEVPAPEPGPYQCLCRILACATCTGTDQKLLSRGLPWEESYPGILGHESVGRVVELGSRARHIREGDLFLRPTAVYPGERLGDYHSCWGGFAEYGLVTDCRALAEDRPGERPPRYAAFQQHIPADLSIATPDATLLITLKEIATFLANVGLSFNASVVVLGAGPVALAMCFFAKVMGAHPVIAVARRDEPLARCRAAGADFTVNNRNEDTAARVRALTGNAGADLVLDAAGDAELVAEAGHLLAPRGKLALYAMGHSPQVTIDRFKGPGAWDLCFRGPSEDRGHDYVLGLARLNLIPFNTFYSHIMPLGEIEKGFGMIRNKEAFKIVFEMEG
ncbi:MAG: zinc-binding dehydrogenase [Kiritimatiellae bacterium]|nr:zinc-binding dehydrogenase [Kiritimatiellia bacterium]